MRVMQILPAMNIGGTERGVMDLVGFFKTRGVENIVVSSGGRLTGELKKMGIKHYQVPVHRKSPISLFYIGKLKLIIKKENIDIVHARSRVPAWLSFFATRKTNAHFITTAHGVYKSRLSSEVMGWGKYVICPSKLVARHMKDNFGVPENKIRIIQRWVDLDKFTFRDYSQRITSNTIVSLGRISPSKGYEFLIEAFKKVVRFNPYLKLQIIGSADKSKLRYLEYLKTLVSRFSLNYNVEFCGFHKDVENLLNDARILVAPSIIEESFGRVAIEGFACGVPVIASNVGGFKEIIENDKDAILVEPKNSEALAEAILKILKNPQYATELTLHARKKAEEKYRLEYCLDLTKKVYEDTTQNLNILVIKISSLGDLILSFPSLKALRTAYPQARITLLVLKKYYALLNGCPYVDEIVTVDNDYKKNSNIFKISKALRRSSFDYIIDLQNNRSSHLISFLSFSRFSFGFRLRWGRLLTNSIVYDRRLNPLDSQEKVLKLLGVNIFEKKLVYWEQKAQKRPLSGQEGELVGINLSASLRWVSKNWPLEHIRQLISLIQKNLPEKKIVLIGEDSTKSLAENIEKSMPSRLINLCGKTTLGDLAQVLGRLQVFITPDTATLHLAQSLGVKVIALFGPTDPKRHTVPAPNLIILSQNLPCSFCYKPKCKFSTESLCLERITPQLVFDKIKEVLR